MKANAFNSSTVLVDWKAPADDKQNGVIRAYQIYIQPKNTVSMNFNNFVGKYIHNMQLPPKHGVITNNIFIV